MHFHTHTQTHMRLNTYMAVSTGERIDTISYARTNTHGVEHAHGRLHERGNRYPFICPYKHTWGYFTTLTYTVMGAGQSRIYPAACEGGPRAGTSAAVLGKTFFFFREASVCMYVCDFFFSLYWNTVLLPGKSHGWGSLVGCSPWGRKVGQG